MLNIYSWNVNGIRAAQKKGFLDWLYKTQPDILGIQETKAHPDQLDAELKEVPGYHTYWASAERKGYSGVALYSRIEPVFVQFGLGIDEYDVEGRTIVADYDDFVLITAYFPNGGEQNNRVPFKMAYKEAFRTYCNNLREQGRKLVFCGDVNTAHREIDLARPKENENSTGFLPEERVWIDKIIEDGYVDSFRYLYPDLEEAYSWWAYWGNARDRNIGWRIDYCFTTPDLIDRILDAKIHTDVFGSDHCPISLTLSTE